MHQHNSKVIFFLISISILATLSTQIRPELILSFGMSNYYLVQGEYLFTFIQFFSSQFIHGDFFHLIFNGIFVFIFGNYVSRIIGEKLLTLFFTFSSIFIGICLLFLSKGITIGMSGFALGLLSYYTFELYSQSNNQYKGGILAIMINIFIGFTPGISLLGHLFGVISGIIFFIGLKIFKGISNK